MRIFILLSFLYCLQGSEQSCLLISNLNKPDLDDLATEIILEDDILLDLDNLTNPTDTSMNLICSWIVKVPSSKQITLELVSFNLQESIGCQIQGLHLLEGTNKNGRLIGSYCGSNYPKLIKTSSSSLYLIYADFLPKGVENLNFGDVQIRLNSRLRNGKSFYMQFD